MFNYRKLLISIILFIAIVIFTHNTLYYPLLAGYDATSKITYAKIISEEFRFPTQEETSNQTYDAPIFYFISGLTARLIATITGSQFIEAIGTTRIFICFLAIFSFYIWYKKFSYFYPKEKNGSIIFLLLLSAMPAFYKIGSMYVPELFCLFIATVIVHFYINFFLKKPSYKNVVILSILTSIGLLTRISFFSLTLALFISMALFFLTKKQVLTGLKKITVFSLVIISLTGWFYLIKHSGRLIDFGDYSQQTEAEYENVPLYKRQRLAFYFDIPFRYMMNYPIRPYLSRPSYLIPIYYSDFWGDYWNFFTQRRFGAEEFKLARENRYYSSNNRRQYLSWQNWVNLAPSLLMVAGFIYLLINRTICVLKKNSKRRILAEFFLLMFAGLTWASLIVILSKYPGEGDFIKVSYTVYIIPIYIYFTVVFLFTYLKKIKIIFWPILSILLFSVINNYIFSWF